LFCLIAIFGKSIEDFTGFTISILLMILKNDFLILTGFKSSPPKVGSSYRPPAIGRIRFCYTTHMEGIQVFGLAGISVVEVIAAITLRNS